MADINSLPTNALFEQLLQLQWKGVPFPTSQFSLELRHDLARHKYPDRDGENIEETGRAALQFTASIPFLNGATPGKGETWGILYPTGWRLFMDVAKEGATGSLIHPELGPIWAKLEQCRTTWTADRRDGVVVECTWLETVPSGEANSGFLAGRPSPIAEVLLSALDLDAQLGTVTPPFPTLPVYKPDFASTMRSLTSVTDQISLASQRGVGQLGAIQYRVNALQTSIENVQASPATTVKAVLALAQQNAKLAQSVLLWPIRNSLEQMRSAANDLKQVIGTTGKPVKTYVTQIDMSLGAIAQNLGVTIGDVIALNPQACSSAVVKALTSIRYYPPLTLAA